MRKASSFHVVLLRICGRSLIFGTRADMDMVLIENSGRLPGPSGLTTVALTIQCTGNGHSTNGSSSDTTKCPRKRTQRPEAWKRAVANSKRARGEEYVSLSTGKMVAARTTGPPCSCRLKYFECFNQREKANVLQSFYQLGNKELQDAQLFGLIHPSSRWWAEESKASYLHLHGKCISIRSSLVY